MAITSELCQINGGCMGCCGHDFTSKKSIKKAIQLNTEELLELKPNSEKEFIEFRDREYVYNLREGVCRNLVNTTPGKFEVKKEECIHCQLHPSLNNKKDLRIGHCDTNYLCETTKYFNSWDKQMKEKFLKFIENKKLDNISYSIGMDNGSFLKEFFKQLNI